MSFKTIESVAAKTLLANPTGAPAPGKGVLVGDFMSLVGNTLNAAPCGGRDTTGTITLAATDDGCNLVSTDGVSTIYVLPAGLRAGFWCNSYQGSAGIITYAPGAGASIANGAVTSAGTSANGKCSKLIHTGSGVWVIQEDYIELAGADLWAAAAQTNCREGDTCTYTIYRPPAALGAPTCSITVTSSDINAAGFDQTLVQTLNNLVALDDTITFDGTDTLTFTPETINPIALSFYAIPTYTNVGNRDATIEISAPSIGSLGTASAVTHVLNTSYFSAATLFPPTLVAVNGNAAGSQATIVMASVAKLKVLDTVTGSGNIPGQTWIKSISGNTITLSANLTGQVDDATVLTFKPAGIWFKADTADQFSMDGSNKVATWTDAHLGYSVTQSTANKKPVWVASSLNSLGGLQCKNAGVLSELNLFTPGQISKTSTTNLNPGAQSVTLNNVTSLTVGMLVSLPNTWVTYNGYGMSQYSPPVITDITGNVVTFSNWLIQYNTVTFSGSTFLFTPVGNGHPLITLLDNAGRQMTVISVVKRTTASGGGWQLDNMSATLGFPYMTLTPAPMQQVSPVNSVGNTYIYMSVTDGRAHDVFINNTKFQIDVTLAAPCVATDATITVVDNSGIRGAQYAGMRIADPYAKDSSGGVPYVLSTTGTTGITINGKMNRAYPAGTVFRFYSCSENGPESARAWKSQHLQIGTGLDGILYELIVVPRMMSPVERNAVHAYLENKWGVGLTQTVNGTAAAGSRIIPLTASTNVTIAKKVTGTGIQANTMVVGLNTTASPPYILLDKDIVAPGVSNGATLTFKSPAFKQPKAFDISLYDPYIRDDFTNGLQPWTDRQVDNWVPLRGKGWETFGVPASGNGDGLSSPPLYGGTLPGNALFLDTNNYAPWRAEGVNPFSLAMGVEGAETGCLLVTTIPRVNLPDSAKAIIPTSYPYISGTIGNDSSCRLMFGYHEARVKISGLAGDWPAWWLLSNDSGWPPEIDILENYQGLFPGVSATTLHCATSSTEQTQGHDTTSAMNSMVIYQPGEFALYGCLIEPTEISFYVNREFSHSHKVPWDFITHWWQTFNGQYQAGGGADLTTPRLHYLDWTGGWRPKAQTPSVSATVLPETTNLIAAMTNQSLPPGRATAINTLIASLKTFTTAFGVSLWDRLDCLYIPAAHDPQAARINWKNPAQIATVVGSPTFTTDRGYSGVTGSSYINTGLNLAMFPGLTLTAQKNHIGAVLLNSGVAVQNKLVGSVGSSRFWLQVYDAAAYAPLAENYTCFNLFGGTPNLVRFGPTGGVMHSSVYSTTNCHFVSSRWYYHGYQYVNGDYASASGGNARAALDTDNLLFGNSAYTTACFHAGFWLSADDIRDLNRLLYAYLQPIGVPMAAPN